MLIRRLFGRSPVMATLASLMVFASSTRARLPNLPTSLENEVTEMRAENGVIREQLRKLEEQQKTVMKMMEELRRRLDGQPAAGVHVIDRLINRGSHTSQAVPPKGAVSLDAIDARSRPPIRSGPFHS